MSSRHIVFLDTNTYVHCRSIEEIPWPTLIKAPVTIIIPRTTISELDKIKDTHPQNHIRDRARRALQNIEKWTAAPTFIRENVAMEEYRALPTISFAAYHLDHDRADDYLIGTILQYQEDHPAADITLVSYDTGARLTARALHITTLVVPEAYRLPPRADPAERENQELKTRLRKLEGAAPKLALTFPSNATHLAVALRPSAPRSDEEARQALERMRGKHRPLHPGAEDPLLQSVPEEYRQKPPPREYERYNSELAIYFERYEAYLNEWYEKQDLDKRTFPIKLVVANDGGAPGKDVDISITFIARVKLLTFDPRGVAGPPSLPLRPRTGSELLLAATQLGLAAIAPRPPIIDFRGGQQNVTDPTVTSETQQHTIAWHIDHIKHGSPIELDTLYLIFDTREDARSFALPWRIHAANYPEAITGALHFIIT